MKDRLLAILIWACFGWLLAIALYAALAGAGESTMPGERAALKNTCANTPPFFCLAGRPGGQTLTCGTNAADGCTFNSTAHATKGKIAFDGFVTIDKANKALGVGTVTPNVGVNDFVNDGSWSQIRQTQYGTLLGTATSAFYGRCARGSLAPP